VASSTDRAGAPSKQRYPDECRKQSLHCASPNRVTAFVHRRSSDDIYAQPSVAALTQPPSVAATSVHVRGAMVCALKWWRLYRIAAAKITSTTAQSTVEATVVGTARLCKAGLTGS
jgi:hypothetical protein